MSYEEAYHRAVHLEQIDETIYDRQSRLHARLYLPGASPRDAVFEYGVGMGSNLFAVQADKKLGYDISEFALEFCRSKALPVTNRFEEVPFHAWDWVLARHVLEHVPDPRSALLRLRDLLKEDGRLVVVVPQEQWFMPGAVDSMDVNQHLFSWTPRTISNLLLACGYRVHSLVREPLSMKKFLLRRGIIADPYYRFLVRASDRLRLGTCPGELIVTAGLA